MDKSERNAAQRARRKANPERARAHTKLYYQKTRLARLAYLKQYRASNHAKVAAGVKKRLLALTPEERAKRLEDKRAAALLSRYGLTGADYDAMLASQGGTCAICHRTPSDERHRKLNIDHCHSTGKIRGLLCSLCNRALGALGDTADSLRRALAYLEK